MSIVWDIFWIATFGLIVFRVYQFLGVMIEDYRETRKTQREKES